MPRPTVPTPVRCRARRGFTLVELIVGGVVIAVIGGAIVSALSNMVKTKNKSVARQQAFARADAAGARIASDVAAAVRSSDLAGCRFQVLDGGAGPVQRDGLLVLMRSLKPVRGREDMPEGGEYEAQYRVDGSGQSAGLWRRVDPGFDRAHDAGGVATLLAPGVVSFSVQAYDGTAWFDSWESDSDGIPHAIRVEIRAQSDDGTADAVVRRVAAVDRVPTPPDSTESAATTESTDTGGGTGSPGGGS
ncbi:MAG: GspJ family type II secretion system protein [Phycisphaerales bacterium]|nr:GspJ family type II secretion system protein [Phycisphaerales bacterium]